MAYRHGLGVVWASAGGGTVESPVRDRPEWIESLSPTDPAGAERTARLLLQRAERAVQNAEVAARRRGYQPVALRDALATVRAIVGSGPWPMSLDEPLVGVRDRVEDILEAARRLGAVT